MSASDDLSGRNSPAPGRCGFGHVYRMVDGRRRLVAIVAPPSDEDWNRRVRASRGEIDHGMHCTTDALDDVWSYEEDPWTWSAIATLLALLAGCGALLWWATA